MAPSPMPSRCWLRMLGDAGKIRTVLPEGIEIRDIYRLAADRDIQLRRMNYRRDSLEDIFLKAMDMKNGGSQWPFINAPTSPTPAR